MSPTLLSSSPGGPGGLMPPNLLEGIAQSKQDAIRILQQSLSLAGTVGGERTAGPTGHPHLPELEKPVRSDSINDLSLRLGLLQDALNQLLTQVSRTEIKQRLNTLEKENQKQLEATRAHFESAAAAAAKHQEAERKGHVGEAISNWIQAGISVASMVVTLAAAIAEIADCNPVAATGLIVAAVALEGAAIVQVTVAIDSTIRATGQEGFLSETDRKNMQIAADVLGGIALAASLLGLIAGAVGALVAAARTAAMVTGRTVTLIGASKLVAQGTKEIATRSMNMSVGRAATYTYRNSMQELLKMSGRLAVIHATGAATRTLTKGVGDLQVAALKQDAAELQLEADRADAAAKAVQAMVTKLRSLIEELEAQLESLVEQGQQTMQIIFGAIDESAESLTRIQQTTSA